MRRARPTSTTRRCSTSTTVAAVLHLAAERRHRQRAPAARLPAPAQDPAAARARVRPRRRPVREPAEDHARRPRRPHRGRGRRRGARPRDQGRSVPPRRDLDPRAVRVDMAVSCTARGHRTRSTSSTSRCRGADGDAGRRDPRPARRACPTPGSCCIPTSWASARCSTTCAAGSPRTASRCARPSRSRARRSTCAATPTPTARMAYVTQLDDELQIGDLEAAADYLVVHDDVQRGRGARASAWAACRC